MYSSNNPYRPLKAEVIEVIDETSTIKTLTLKPEDKISFETGHVIELSVPGVGEAPFTPSSEPAVNENIQVSVMNVGKVTAKIHCLEPGSIVGLRGPFGNGYPLEVFRDREIVVTGGGCGFAPLRSLLYELFSRHGWYKKLLFRGGCRSSKDMLYKDEILEWPSKHDIDVVLTVDIGDDSWDGPVGVVTTILEDFEVDIPEAVAVVCGPPIMMKFSTQKLLETGFRMENIYVSMEKNMSCGMGKCGHCRIGPFYACQDGPVFRFDKICHLPNIWD
jgi:NAD(P)H-flavin reductase